MTNQQRWLRRGVFLFAVIDAGLGLWTLLFPRAFYDYLPTVNLDPPFNEHLFRDFGGMNLGMAVVLGVAAYFVDRRMMRAGLVGVLFFAIPHLVFHTFHLPHYFAAESVPLVIALEVSLILFAVVPLTLLIGSRGMPREWERKPLTGTEP